MQFGNGGIDDAFKVILWFFIFCVLSQELQ